MYYFIRKYKEVILNAIILVALILICFDFHKDFFLGAAFGAILIMLGESFGNLKTGRNRNQLSREDISVINK